MADCSRCKALVDEEHIPDSRSLTYNPGDIIGIQDSVHVPIDHVFNNRHRNSSSRRSSNFSTGSRAWIDNGRGGRPAIVLERRPIESKDGSEETVVLLLATYEGDYRLRSHLPLVLQFFCIAVYPHSTIAEDEAGVFHLHTSPEWYNSRKDANDLHGWLIARQFTSTKPTTGRWKNANRSNWASESSFTVEHETRMRLLEIVEEKWEEWVASCEQDPQRLYRYKQDYHNFRNKMHHYNPSSPSRTRNATPSARSPSVASAAARSTPGPRSPPRSPAGMRTGTSFAQALENNTTRTAPTPIAHTGNGSARPAAHPSSTPAPRPSAGPTIVPDAASSSIRPATSGQSAWARPAVPQVANGNAMPPTTGPPPASEFPSLSATPQVTQTRPAVRPLYSQAVKQQARGGAGARQQQPPRK